MKIHSESRQITPAELVGMMDVPEFVQKTERMI